VAKKTALEQEYREAGAEAGKNNAFEQRPQDAPEDSFVTAHLRGGFGGRWVNFSIQG
jgi:hypothetical protein